ncbi:hypothetical protein AWZ03_006863 [Drosophila navojoa]|uniref:Uncharacterized protein n=1 Tax=Drosophila navojoa TaxID=7232 RepID=A0A484BCY9_DRONA|nr:hypothetical protein AWZ03_006863 [Drosophila navojoa]
MTRFSCCQHRFTTLQKANDEDIHDDADAAADDDDNFAFKLFGWGNCSFSPTSRQSKPQSSTKSEVWHNQKKPRPKPEPKPKPKRKLKPKETQQSVPTAVSSLWPDERH